MKLKRIEALELLAALRGLDGVRNGDKVTAFVFTPEVVDKVVGNILALKSVQFAVEEYQKEAARMTASDGSPLSERLGSWLATEIDMPLQPITKSDLNVKSNPIPVSIRVGLSYLDIPAGTA